MESKSISHLIKEYITDYLEMDLRLVKTRCPYWMNKINKGKVVFRGKFNGKGSSQEIKAALKKSLIKLPPNTRVTQENVFKLAKRERIGIDCSGLVYQILDKLLNYYHLSLSQVFP